MNKLLRIIALAGLSITGGPDSILYFFEARPFYQSVLLLT